MKYFITIATTLFASYTMACPQLAGNYQCDSEDGPEMVGITQMEMAGVTTYFVDGDEMIADGNTHPVNDSGLVGSYITTCEGEKVKFNIDGDLFEGTQKMGSMHMSAYMMKSGTGITLYQKGYETWDGETYPIDDNILCTAF